MKKITFLLSFTLLALAGEPKLISMDPSQAERAGIKTELVTPTATGVAGKFSGEALLPPENQKVVSLLFPATVEKVHVLR